MAFSTKEDSLKNTYFNLYNIQQNIETKTGKMEGQREKTNY